MAVRSTWFIPPTAEPRWVADSGGGSGEVESDAGAHPKVVAHFLDGHLLKGFALDFRPSRRDFLLRPRHPDEVRGAIPIRVADLKALFFVKEFDGDLAYRELKDAARPSLLGRKVRVECCDGEVLRGTTPSQDLHPGFFLVPLDPRSNNRRVYIVAANAVECRFEGGDGS